MARKAGVITINLNAGTAQFMQDMNAAGAKVQQFGRSVHEAGAGSRASFIEASAGIRALEGNFNNNIRAVERFAATTLGLGPVFRTIFPLVGGVAFASLLGEMTVKAYEFYKSIRDAGEKAHGVFTEMNAPLRLTNDELAVANDRLQNEISKLEGKHQNTLKLALDEARVAADRLADSLDKDLAGLHKVLDEQNVGFFRRLLGEAGTSDIAKEIGGETGYGGFRGRVREIESTGNEKIRQATDLRSKDAAQLELAKNLQAAYNEEVAKFNRMLSEAQEKAKPVPGMQIFDPETGKYSHTLPSRPGQDERGRIEELTGTLQRLRYEQAGIGLETQNTDLTARRDTLAADRANAQQDRPFEDRMKAIAAQIDGMKAKLEAIGQSEAAQVLAKAFGASQKAIEEVNKALEKHNTHLTDAQKAQIRQYELTLASTEAEAEWKTKLASASTSIAERIQAQELLTAAIGKGYEATRQANIETRLMQELGQHASDPAWLQSHQSDVTNLRGGFSREFDAHHAEQSAQAVDKLNDQIELERELARVQSQGAEAVREATLAIKLRQAAAAGATKEQMQAEIELFNAQRANAAASGVAQIEERIAATQRLTAAILGGAEAERQAALENKYAGIRREGDQPVPGAVGIGQKELAERAADQADHQREIASEALKTGLAYQNELNLIAQQVAALEKIKTEQGDTLAIEISLRDLANKRLQTLTAESLAIGGARDGLRAFFLEMQQDAKTSAQVVYDALNSAVDKVSSNLTKAITGQKTAWGAAFKEIGDNMLQSTLKSGLQKGLGALGKAFGVDLGGAKPDGTANNPLWVRVVGPGGGLASAAAGIPGGLFGSGAAKAAGSGIFSFLGGLFKGGGNAVSGGANPFESVTSSIDFGGFMADGGPVDPGKAYVVGENGPEPFIPRTAGTILSNRSFGGSSNSFVYNIDARGADLGAHNRIQRGIEASHRSAVATAVQAQAERTKRTPQK